MKLNPFKPMKLTSIFLSGNLWENKFREAPK